MRMALVLTVLTVSPIAVVAGEIKIKPNKENVVASRLLGEWQLDPQLTERLTGRRTSFRMSIAVREDAAVALKVPQKFVEFLENEHSVVSMTGYLKFTGVEYPFLLTYLNGNPYVFYFREKNGDPYGDSESFNLIVAPAKDLKNDLLFIGGDFNNQPFTAYTRAKPSDDEK